MRQGVAIPGFRAAGRLDEPLMGSPKIDAGNRSVCTSAPVTGFDQRGFLRASPCDMGACEFGAGVASNPSALVPALSDRGVLLVSLQSSSAPDGIRIPPAQRSTQGGGFATAYLESCRSIATSVGAHADYYILWRTPFIPTPPNDR
jgi:hypothetical protein